MGKIMAVKAGLLEHLPKNKLITDGWMAIVQLIESNGEWLERDLLEIDKSYRQPIPYVLLRRSAEPPNGEQFVLMQRCKGQGEKRLLGKHYIGAGGHVEEGHNLFYTAMLEVTEELGLPIATLHGKGVMVTDGSDVDDVHVCVFYEARTTYQHFTSPEGPQHEARWAKLGELRKHLISMEKWSQVIARDYLRLHV